ncbi:aldo/keto reductase [Streptomyces sp. NPDC087420]|uniref:aldo/keto reductase n=1 Tax=Streptomyces sp. NPDC087420 TaxID=3365785 RepID=UPI003835E00D
MRSRAPRPPLGCYTTFGHNTGLRVSEVALGAGTFGTRALAGTEQDEARRILDRSEDAGGTFIDTSESYQAGESEEILGELLTGRRDRGGLSNFPAWRSSHAVALSELRGLAPVIGVQFEYSLVERTAEREILPMAEAHGLGGALWSPLGGGLLTGKYRTSAEGRPTDWGRIVHTEDSRQKTAVVDAVLTVAKEAGVRPAQVAVAWVRERAERSVTPLVPVIGPRSLARLEDYLGALDVRAGPDCGGIL